MWLLPMSVVWLILSRRPTDLVINRTRVRTVHLSITSECKTVVTINHSRLDTAKPWPSAYEYNS